MAVDLTRTVELVFYDKNNKVDKTLYATTKAPNASYTWVNTHLSAINTKTVPLQNNVAEIPTPPLVDGYSLISADQSISISSNWQYWQYFPVGSTSLTRIEDPNKVPIQIGQTTSTCIHPAGHCSDASHNNTYRFYPYYYKNQYKATFYNVEGTVLQDTYVNAFSTVIPPTYEPIGCQLIGWDKPLTNIKADTSFYPVTTTGFLIGDVISLEGVEDAVQRIITTNCQNIDKIEYPHEYYSPSFYRTYSNNAPAAGGLVFIKRKITSESMSYISEVSQDQLIADIQTYFSTVKSVITKYTTQLVQSDITLLYYFAMLYFIQNSVFYVHGFKLEEQSDWHDCMVVYVSSNLSIDKYITNFQVYRDVIQQFVTTANLHNIIYSYTV